MAYQNLTTDNTRNPSSLLTLLCGVLVKIGCQMENKIKSWKKPRSSYSPGPLLPEIQNPILDLYGEGLKIYPHVKFLGITFDSKFTFQEHFEEILGAAIPGTSESDFQSTKNGNRACPPYYKFTMCPASFRIWLSFDHNNIGHDYE